MHLYRMIKKATVSDLELIYLNIFKQQTLRDVTVVIEDADDVIFSCLTWLNPPADGKLKCHHFEFYKL